MDTKVKNAVKKDVIEWIQTLDNEKILFNLYELKEHYRQITPEEKEEYNRWLAALDYEPQLEMLRSIIASSPDRDAIWNELSPEAQENIRTDEEVETADIKHTPEQFWDLVSDLREGDNFSWDELSEADKKSIEQGMADAEAGRITPHEEVWKKQEQWLNGMKLKQIKEDIPDLPENIRAEIANFVLETLHRPDPKVEQAGGKDPEEEIVSGPPMGPKITSAEPLDDFFLRLTFENGEERKIDMKPFQIGVFTPLKNLEYFKRVRVVDGSIAWPDDQDLHHDMLYHKSEPLYQ